MKYIQKFENKQLQGWPVKMTKVDFTGGGDGVYALYIDGELKKYGDYYHDKIENWIDAFIEGVKWADMNVIYEVVKCNSDWVEEVSEFAGIPPSDLNDVFNSPKVNELFGINKKIRDLKYEDESEAKEIIFLEKEISNLIYNEKKVKDSYIKEFSFTANKDKYIVKFINWLHPVLTPGMTDYTITLNGKILNCSKNISKEVFLFLSKIR